MKPLTKCPICGSRRIERKKQSVTLRPRGRALVVRDVLVDHCLNCGETFFDHEASLKIDAALPRAAGRNARRKSA